MPLQERPDADRHVASTMGSIGASRLYRAENERRSPATTTSRPRPDSSSIRGMAVCCSVECLSMFVYTVPKCTRSSPGIDLCASTRSTLFQRPRIASECHSPSRRQTPTQGRCSVDCGDETLPTTKCNFKPALNPVSEFSEARETKFSVGTALNV